MSGKILVSTLKNIQSGKDKIHSITIDEVYEYDMSSSKEDLLKYTSDCDFVVHLAGVNRPIDPKEFYDGNAGFTEVLCNYLKKQIIDPLSLSARLFRLNTIMIMEKAKARRRTSEKVW